MYTKLRYYLGLLALAVLTLASCSKSRVYEQVIPAEADFVLSVSVDQLVKKSEILSKENKELRDQLFPNSSAPVAKILRPLLEDPSKVGIDFKSPIYLFTTPDLQGAFLARVSDEGKLKKFLSDLTQIKNPQATIEQKDGISILNGTDNNAIAFTKDALLVLIPTTETKKDMRVEAIQLLKLKEGKRYHETSSFKELKSKKSDLSFILDYKKLFSLYSYYAGQLAPNQFAAQGVDMSKMQIALHINFESGVTTTDIKYISEDKETLEKFTELSKKVSPKRCENKYGKLLAKDNLFFMNGYISGPEILNSYKDNPALSEAFESLSGMGIEPSSIFSAVDGEFALSISSFNPLKSGGLPITFYAESKSPQGVDAIAQAIEEKSKQSRDSTIEVWSYDEPYIVQTEDEHQYVARKEGEAPLYFGYKDGSTYFALGEGAKATLFKEQKPNISEATYSSILKGHSASMALDLNYLFTGTPIGAFVSGFAPKEVSDRLKAFSYLSATNDGVTGHMELKLSTKENLLKLLTDLARIMAVEDK